jgi:HPt (histidine-containing phosphotransfer) domain-containing protein
MNDYVAKPIRLPDLIGALERAAAGTMGATPSPAALDPRALATLREMFADTAAGTLPALLDAFFEDGPRLIADMCEGIAAGTPALVQRAAHTLKSDAAQFGATRLSDLCRELEYLARWHARRGGHGAEYDWDSVARGGSGARGGAPHLGRGRVT